MPSHYAPTNPEKIGASLQEVDISFSGREDHKLTTKWYHAPGVDADALIWMDHRENIIKQQINISGVVVEWNVLDGLRTGVIIEQELKESETSQSIRYDENSNNHNLEMAIRLVRNIPALDEATRVMLLTNFEKPDSFKTLSPQEILFRYGRLPQGTQLSLVQRFLVKLRRWLS